MKMNLGLGYFVSVVVVGRWFGTIILWRRVLEVVFWSGG